MSVVGIRRQPRPTRAVREVARARGERSLKDREVLLAVGRSLVDGDLTLSAIAESMEVAEAELAAALERLFGVVPAPPSRRS